MTKQEKKEIESLGEPKGFFDPVVIRENGKLVYIERENVEEGDIIS